MRRQVDAAIDNEHSFAAPQVHTAPQTVSPAKEPATTQTQSESARPIGRARTLSHTGFAMPRRSSPLRQGPHRSKTLYADALARRERHLERADLAERQRQTLEEDDPERLLQLRRWRAHLHDSRTHEEREEALLRRRQERHRAGEKAQLAREQEELMECTFTPAILSSMGAGRSSPSRMRSNSPASSSLQTRSATGSSANSAVGEKLQRLLEKQLMHVRQLGELDVEQKTQRSFLGAGVGSGGCPDVESGHDGWDAAPSATAGTGQSVEVDDNMYDSPRDNIPQTLASAPHAEQEAAVKLYRGQLALIHALERLDLQALDLAKDELDTIGNLGFRLGLADNVRRTMQVAHQGHAPSLHPCSGSPGSSIAVTEGSPCNGRWPLRDSSVNSWHQDHVTVSQMK